MSGSFMSISDASIRPAISPVPATGPDTRSIGIPLASTRPVRYVCDMQPDPAMLEKLVSDVLEVVKPLRIILFGSAARGEMTQRSDLDVMVVVPDGARQNRIAKDLYHHVSIDISKDFVVVTKSQLEDYADWPYTPIMYALREGKELYRAAGS